MTPTLRTSHDLAHLAFAKAPQGSFVVAMYATGGVVDDAIPDDAMLPRIAAMRPRLAPPARH